MGDLEAIRAGAARLAANTSVVMAARDMTGLGKAATVARAGLDELARAGVRLQGTAGAGARLAADVAAIARPAQAARAEIAATAAAVDKLGTAARGISSGDGLSILTRDAVAARRAFSDTGQAAASLERQIDALVASAGELKAWSPAQASAAMKSFDAQVKAGRAEIGALEEAAAKVGTASGPRHLGEGLAAVASNAAEARREVDFVGNAAARAARDLDKMGAARGHAGSVDAGEGQSGGASASGRHAGPGGLRGALVAGARPLHMERLLMSAMTPTGLAGLGAGLGLAGVAHEIQDATGRAIDLEDAMNRLRRTVGDISPERMKGLEGEIMRTSRATGVATGDLATMAATASAAGRPFAELPQFMDLGAKAAGALGIKADEAAGAMTRIGSDFKLDGNGLRSTLDAIATLQERTGASGAGTLDFLSRVGPVASLARMQPAQVAAYGGTMQQAGMSPGQSAGLFGDVLTKLLSGEKGGEPYMNGLHKMRAPDGDPESAFALQRLARVDPSAAMVRFLEDVKTLSKERRFTVLSEIVGPEQAEALSRMSEHVDELTRNLGVMQDKGAQRGGLERVFKLFDDATSKKIEHATAAIGAFSTRIGQAFAPAVGAAAEATARLFNSLSDVMDASKTASSILDKQGKGQSLSSEEQSDLDKNPRVRSFVGLDPHPEATAAKRETERLGALKSIGDLDATARETQDPQIRAMVEQMRQDYRQQFPDKPLPAFASGGQARGPGGPTGDGILARVSDGEFIVNARSTAKHLGTIKAINDDRLPAFATGGAVGVVPSALAMGTADPAALDRLEGAVQSGVKAGVVEGLRDANMRRVGSALGMAGAGGEGDGDAGGIGEGGGARPNLRYGRRAAGAPNLRYGTSGGRARGTPRSRAHGAYAATPSGRPGSGAGGSAYGQAGGWQIGSGDGSATTDNAGPGFTAGMKARNLGNIGYFGQHDAGLVGPSNAHDVDHSIAMYATQEDGVRAAARLALRKYQGGMRSTWDLIAGRPVNGHATIKGAWTPGSLGGGASVNIAKAMGLSNQDDLHLDQPGQMHKFLRGLATQEHGSAGAYYSDAMIDRALKGGGPAQPPANAERTVAGSPDRRGFANLMHGQYGEPGQNLTSITTPSGRKATVHAAAAESFQGFLGDLEKSGYNINSLGGYANRGMAGNPGRISQHAYGNAIDINPAQNPFHTSRTDLPRNVSDMAAKWGLSWGGDWSERSRDPMHFEWTGAQPWKNKQGPAATAQNRPPVMPFGLTGTALEAMDKARAAKAVAAVEDRASRSTATERQAAVMARPLSPRFTDPGLKQAYDKGTAGGGGPAGAAPGRGGPGHGQPVVQNFYGQHDPRETAHRAKREANREISRSRGRALFGVGALS